MSYLKVLVLFLVACLVPTASNLATAAQYEIKNRAHSIAAMIGRIDVGDGGSTEATGSGTLVGVDLVLTAAHVVFNENEGRLWRRIKFRKSMVDGKSEATSHAAQVWYSRDKDWAILRLAAPLGATGYMGVRVATPEELEGGRTFTIAGYRGHPFDAESAWVDDDVQIYRVEGSEMLHNAATSPGSSGSAIWTIGQNGYPLVIAVHVAVRSGTPYKIATSASHFAGRLRELRESGEGTSSQPTVNITNRVSEWRNVYVFDSSRTRILGSAAVPPNDSVEICLSSGDNGRAVYIEARNHKRATWAAATVVQAGKLTRANVD